MVASGFTSPVFHCILKARRARWLQVPVVLSVSIKTMNQRSLYAWILFWAIQIQVITAASTASAPSPRRTIFHSSGGKQSRQRATGTNSNISELAPGPACSFYLWDAMSALLYRWCSHLQADCIYEGRGGKKVSTMYSVVLKSRGV